MLVVSYLRDARDVVLAVLVQAFMCARTRQRRAPVSRASARCARSLARPRARPAARLAQVGLFYGWMRLRTPRTASPPTDAPWSGDYAPSDDVPVSFIVPVRDERARDRAHAARARARVRRDARDALEVVVVDAGCSDDTMAVVARVAADRAVALPRVVATAVAAGRRARAGDRGGCARGARRRRARLRSTPTRVLPRARARALVRDALGRERACVLCAFRSRADRDEARALTASPALAA